MSVAVDGGAAPRLPATRSRSREHVAAGLAIAAGCLALATRPVAWAAFGVTLVVGAVGALHPLDVLGERRRDEVAAIALGVAAFALARMALGGSVNAMTATFLATSIIAAVAEEAFFRRLCYGRLLRWGVSVAIAGSAIAFAAVHVAGYGLRALPVDLAAGLLFGWQRWATGSWAAPAATHAAANVLMIL